MKLKETKPYILKRLVDGGGIRGISTLLILQNLMERIKHERRLNETPRPCEYFDLIGGTSTGGYVS